MPFEAFFKQNTKLLGLGRQFGQINFVAIGVLTLGRFISTHFGTVSHCPLSMFSINQPLFLQKTKPLHPHAMVHHEIATDKTGQSKGQLISKANFEVFI